MDFLHEIKETIPIKLRLNNLSFPENAKLNTELCYLNELIHSFSTSKLFRSAKSRSDIATMTAILLSGDDT